jgi:1,4-dihydroxy-2-naphthoate octaprenyltransferase
VGMATTAILVSNNLRDRDEDSQAGIRTLGDLADGRVGKALYAALVLGAPLGLAAIGALGAAGAMGSRIAGPPGLLAAPLAAILIVKPLRAVLGGRRVPDIDAQTARFVTGLLVVATLAYVLR